jgi:hypothetical protein
MVGRHLGDEQRTHRLAHVRAKTLADRGKAEAPESVRAKHTDRSDASKEPIKG